jgi:hypothetical protein
MPLQGLLFLRKNKVDTVAEEWSRRVISNWDLLRIVHPDRFQMILKRTKGQLSTGVFATAMSGIVVTEVRVIVMTDTGLESRSLDIAGYCHTLKVPCVLGKQEVFAEFSQRITERSRTIPPIPESPPESVIRVVELSVEYDASGEVGGAVDALRLIPSGKIEWIQRKKNCPEN